jgi:hypothetical protein
MIRLFVVCCLGISCLCSCLFLFFFLVHASVSLFFCLVFLFLSLTLVIMSDNFEEDTVRYPLPVDDSEEEILASLGNGCEFDILASLGILSEI